MSGAATIVFDTDCVLCSRWVHFIVANERHPNMTFVNAWSVAGEEIAVRCGFSRSDLQMTYLVVDGDRCLTQSDASIAILARLRAPYRWLTCVRFVPRSLRDAMYRMIAKHRYNWFGYSPHCFVPTPEMGSRFIDR